MTVQLQVALAELDGEQIYNLVTELDKGITAARCELLCGRHRGENEQPISDLLIELLEIKLDALAQIARITVPISEAAKIIYRARYARNHPVRVPGT